MRDAKIGIKRQGKRFANRSGIDKAAVIGSADVLVHDLAAGALSRNHRNIDLARLEHFRDGLAVALTKDQRDMRRPDHDDTGERRPTGQHEVVRHADAEGSRRHGGVKRLPPHKRLAHLNKRRFKNRSHFDRARRRLHRRMLPHEERISSDLAQTRERTADRRLTQIQTQGRPRDAALFPYGEEDRREIEIDAHIIVQINNPYQQMRLAR